MKVDELILPAITALGAAGITGFVAYASAKRSTNLEERRASGRVDTTEAAALWKAQETLREEYREEVIRLRARLDGADSIIAKQNVTILELEKKIARLESGK